MWEDSTGGALMKRHAMDSPASNSHSYYPMKLGIGHDLTRIALDPKHPYKIASEAELLTTSSNWFCFFHSLQNRAQNTTDRVRLCKALPMPKTISKNGLDHLISEPLFISSSFFDLFATHPLTMLLIGTPLLGLRNRFIFFDFFCAWVEIPRTIRHQSHRLLQYLK